MQESDLVQYMDQKRAWYGSDAAKVLLMEVSAALYPIYIKNGCPRYGPILVHCKDVYQAKRIVKELSPFSVNSPLPLSASPKEVKHIMTNYDYDVRIFIWQDSRYVKQNLIQIRDAALFGEEALLVFVIDVGSGVRGYSETFAGEIYLEGDEDNGTLSDEITLSDAQWVREQIVYVLSQKPKINQWRKYIGVEMGVCVFQISKGVLLDFCKYKGADEDFLQKLQNDLEVALNSIEKDWEGGNEAEIIADLFCQAVLDASGWMTGIVNRKKVPCERWNIITDAVWYDGGHYYLSEPLFCDICEHFHGNASIRTIKRQLAEAGVLVMEGRTRTYGTVKVSAFSPYGECRVERRVKLKRNAIDSVRDMTLIEMFGEYEEKE